MSSNYKDLGGLVPLNNEDFREWVNPDSGEVRQGILISPEEVKISQEEKQLRAERQQHLVNKTELGTSINNLGHGKGFFFYRYNDFLDSIGKDYASAFRFLYISTYADYDGLIFRYGQYYKKIPVTLNELKRMLRCNPKTGTKIVNQLQELGLILEKNGCFYINDKYSIRGSLKITEKQEVTRVFINGVRQLYTRSDAKEHKKIGRIIALLEFMHTDTNILCRNPLESDWDEIQPLTMNDVCEILGYERRSTNVVQPMLLSPRIYDLSILGIFWDGKKKVIVVNPYLFYSGSDPQAIRWVVSLFKMMPDMTK